MKRLKYIYGSLLMASLFLVSCKKDSDVFVPDTGQINGPDTNWFNNVSPGMPVSLLNNALQLPLQSDSVDNSAVNTTRVFPSGLRCTFPYNGFVLPGSTSTIGKFQVDALLLKSKGDMVRAGASTVSNGRLLVSGGAFYLKATKNGSELQLAPNAAVNTLIPDLTAQQNMRLYFGDDFDHESINWIPDNDPRNHLSINSQGYEVLSNKLEWFQCGYVYDSTAARITVMTDLPSNYTNANTNAYLVFSNIHSVVKLKADPSLRRFYSNLIPVGNAATLVVISRQGNDYFLGYQGFTTSNAGTNVQLVKVKPVISTLAIIKQFLASL